MRISSASAVSVIFKNNCPWEPKRSQSVTSSPFAVTFPGRWRSPNTYSWIFFHQGPKLPSRAERFMVNPSSLGSQANRMRRYAPSS